MTRAFTVASWNVEHFKNNPDRIDLIIRFLEEQNPDVFGLYEVESADVYFEVVKRMPDYHFHITEGPQVQEILVGAKRNLTAFFTQKIEYKSGVTFLRPGALLTVHLDGQEYPILFLHTKSATKPVGLGLRDDMFERALKFKRVLDKVSAKAGKGAANFLFLGDLNTMGMKYPFKREIIADIEMKKLDRGAKRMKMKRLSKNRPFTWWNGPGRRLSPSNLDHVIASHQLKFKQFNGADVDVRGWPEKATESEQGVWIDRYSDHALLFFQVEK